MTIITETDERFRVNPSTVPGAGDGLFARTSLGEGESLEVIGVLVPAGSVSDVCTRYADHYKFRVGDFLLIPLLDSARWSTTQGTRTWRKSSRVRRCISGQRRPIQPGEELFFTYGEAFFGVAKIDPDSFSSR